MTPQALIELRTRFQAAKQYGRKIANAEAYVAALEAEAGPVAIPQGAAQNSADHLLALVAKVERVLAGEAKAEPGSAEVKDPPKSKGKKPKKKSEEETVAEGAPEEESAAEGATEEAPVAEVKAEEDAAPVASDVPSDV